jgi:hypothetical protein
VVEKKIAAGEGRFNPEGVYVGRVALTEVDVLKGFEEIPGSGERGRNGDDGGEGACEWLHDGTSFVASAIKHKQHMHIFCKWR